MKFDVDDDDLLDPIGDIDIDEKEKYIDNPDEAIELISSIIDNTSINQKAAIDTIKSKVNDIFELFTDIALDNELVYYKRMIDLCDRLAEQKKIKKISKKTVIGLGGGFSAGKSKFINSVSGCSSLPEAQNPTTSIPTYVISSNKDAFTANTIYGSVCTLDDDSMQAMTHKFYDTYQIGFASFVESIIVESKDFKLGKNIALLDTPGYTKFDAESDSQNVRSDKEKAYEQLKKTDRLIWISDITSLVKQEDIDFIRDLGISSPILFVLNKADKIPEEQVLQFLEYTRQTLDTAGINYYDITAYSSSTGVEYCGKNIIERFFEEANQEETVNNDIYKLFYNTELEIEDALNSSLIKTSVISDGLYKYIAASEKVLEIKSVSDIWSRGIMNANKLEHIKRKYIESTNNLNKMVKFFVEGERIKNA